MPLDATDKLRWERIEKIYAKACADKPSAAYRKAAALGRSFVLGVFELPASQEREALLVKLEECAIMFRAASFENQEGSPPEGQMAPT
jgi:hypothetical protein